MTDKFWDGLAVKYAAKPIDDIDAYEAKLKDLSGYLNATDKVLEVGCGTGSTALRLAKLVEHYTATDVSKGMIEIANNKLLDSAPKNIEFIEAPADWVVGEGHFDVILCFSLLHLIRDLPSTLHMLHSQLKPGGLFISKTVCLKHCNPLIRLFVKVLKAIGFAPYVLPLNQQDLENMLQQAGFTIERTTYFDKQKRNPYIVARKAK